MEANNKAMRDALETLVDLVEAWKDHLPPVIEEEVSKAIEKAEAALAEPVKNCEVGTAMEQEDRFRQHCNSRGTFCGDCPLYNNRRGECRFEWAQAPYKEGDGK